MKALTACCPYFVRRDECANVPPADRPERRSPDAAGNHSCYRGEGRRREEKGGRRRKRDEESTHGPPAL